MAIVQLSIIRGEQKKSPFARHKFMDLSGRKVIAIKDFAYLYPH